MAPSLNGCVKNESTIGSNAPQPLFITNPTPARPADLFVVLPCYTGFMAKEDLIEMSGQVLEVLPDARYRVKLETVTSSSPTPTARCASTTFASSPATRFRSSSLLMTSPRAVLPSATSKVVPLRLRLPAASRVAVNSSCRRSCSILF